MNENSTNLPVPAATNGAPLATLRPVFVDITSQKLAHPQRQFVVAHTLLGDQVLCWLEPWLAGLFCIVLIADLLPESAWREMVLMASAAPAPPTDLPRLTSSQS